MDDFFLFAAFQCFTDIYPKLYHEFSVCLTIPDIMTYACEKLHKDQHIGRTLPRDNLKLMDCHNMIASLQYVHQ